MISSYSRSYSGSQIRIIRKRQDSNPRGQKPLIFQVLRYKPDSATFPYIYYFGLFIM